VYPRGTGGWVENTSIVGDVMVTSPKVCDHSAVVADLHDLFADDHVHCALVTDGSRLLSVVRREDLGDDPSLPASAVGTLRGRTVAASTDLGSVHRRMVQQGIRRLAVVTEDGRLVGLLCLKRSGTGFCADDDVAARAAERSSDRVHRSPRGRNRPDDAIRTCRGGR
jgi:signal-transduction protein with cAMP-binding, CBS, and nucleotidyltransferase domain